MVDSYAGKFARIDLTKEKIVVEPMPADWKERFVGGVGIGAKIMWDETTSVTKPLSADNRLIF
ncbi:MAG: aldehyde ferredoxin oxidoreductase N-terminal domain-containing protein, partial [Elusimicrobiota bacterium]|nr:aldehyde ferredoxin oxidoreductase N-terminal domain-containing protein [Elusimicrobiota bacterium]